MHFLDVERVGNFPVEGPNAIAAAGKPDALGLH
jgi:hypothetical protein